MSATTKTTGRATARPFRLERELELLTMLLTKLDQEQVTGRANPEVALLREQVRRGDLMRSAHADAAGAYIAAGEIPGHGPCLLLTSQQEAYLGRDPTPLSMLDFLR